MSTRLKNLLDTWSLPDRTEERTQITLRISYELYCRLHAIKAVYPNRSVNDIICDLLNTSTAELIDLFLVYEVTQDDVFEQLQNGVPEECCDSVGSSYGPLMLYRKAYRSLLESKEKETSTNE